MPNSQSITRLTNDQRARMARLLTEADIPDNNDVSIPLGDIIPVSRRNINANLVNNLINNNNLRQNPPVNNSLANIPGDDEDLYSGGRRRNKKTRKSRKKRKNKSNKSKKRRTRKY
jgi:hypothetical protein